MGNTRNVNAPTYTTAILRLAASLEAPYSLEREDGKAELRAPACGSTIATAVMLDADGRVQSLSQEVRACAFGQASAALLAAYAGGRGKDEIAAALNGLSEWLAGTRDDCGSWPGLEALSPARPKTARHGAILLPFRALLAAMDGA